MDQELMALCAKHGLHTISVCVWPHRELPFSVYAHPDVETCGLGEGKSVAEAVDAAMLDLNQRKEAA